MIKEISVTKYGNDKQLIPTFSSYEIYQYSDAVLKYLPKDSLKEFKKRCFMTTHQFTITKRQWIEEHITETQQTT